MSILSAVALFVACVVALWLFAERLVDSAGRIAKRFGVSDLVVGLTIVAIGTSAPEFAVTVVAAVEGRGNISVGNVAGSNIFNLGFILGGVALWRGLSTSRTLVYRDGGLLLLSTLALVLFAADGSVTRTEGAVLILSLIGYVALLMVRREAPDVDLPGASATWRDAIVLPVSISALVFAAHYLVVAASTLAGAMGVSDWVIGVTVVAAGTSAPEIVVAVAALLKKRDALSAGSLIGSDIFNVLGVLGVAALATPLAVSSESLPSLMLLSSLVIVVLVMMRTGWRLSRLEGAVLVMIAAARWVYDFTGGA
ncbi:MAG TPA: sodium:calcium antiporter [Polyangiaceae bacterium]|nr:sodium:calcium antiporter [Polyangiaceae bacterium]